MGMISRRSRRSDGSPAPSLYQYLAWCDHCEIKYFNSSDQEPHSWGCSDVKLEELVHEMSQQEIDQIKLEVETQYPDPRDLSNRLWAEFFSMKKLEDQFLKYKKVVRDISYEGIAIKRGDHIIADQWYSFGLK